MTLLDYALAYAAKGRLVFPIVPMGKVPATKNGFLDAANEPDKVAALWRNPSCNIGIVTSRASGIWVLDVDIDKETGEDGQDALDDLMMKHGDLPEGPVQRTPSGGRHYCYAWPLDGDLPRRIKFLPGLDALGARTVDGKEYGGYFIAAPSIRSDGEYRWLHKGPLPQAPAWLLAAVRGVRREPPPMAAPRSEGPTNSYGRAALAQLCHEIASCPPGSQDDTLYRKATRIGSLAHGGNIALDEAWTAAVDAGMRMANGKPDHPWRRQEIERKVERAFAYAAQSPTGKPEKDYVLNPASGH